MQNRYLHYDIISVEKKEFGTKVHKCYCRLCGNYFYATSYELNGKTHCGCSKGCFNEFEIFEDYAKMWSKDHSTFALVDIEDIPLLKSFNRTWTKNADGYWCISRPHKQLHRTVMKATNSEVVDHKFHNKDDNRKDFLRKCTRSQNSCNMKPNEDRPLPKGVRVRHNGSFNAYIKCKNVRRTKDFKTLEEAVKQRQLWEDELFGEFSYKEREV